MLKIVNGDLLKAKESIICHQVNCQGVMGSGIAAQIKSEYPEVYKGYLDFCRSFGIGSCILLGKVYYHDTISKYTNKQVIFANIFGQNNYGMGQRQTSYIGLFTGILSVLQIAEETNCSVAIPWNIGCCRGGANWQQVYNFIKSVSEDFKNDIVLYKYDRD